MTEGKFCTKCNEYKLLSEYDKSNSRKMGVRSSCKQCNKPIKQNHYQNNKEKYKRSFQEFILRNPDYYRDYYIANSKRSIKNDHYKNQNI